MRKILQSLAAVALCGSSLFAETLTVDSLVTISGEEVYKNGATNSSTAVVKSGGELVIEDTGVLELLNEAGSSNSRLQLTGGTLVVDGKLKTNAILAQGGTNEITINSANSIGKSNGTLAELMFIGGSLTVNLNASQDFFVWDTRASGLKLVFAENTSTLFDSIKYNSTDATVVLQDFGSTNSIAFNTTAYGTTQTYDTSLDGNKLTFSSETAGKTFTLTFVDGNGNALDLALSNSGNIATLTAVPEPAEWAAIFGATALVLAYARRRR